MFLLSSVHFLICNDLPKFIRPLAHNHWKKKKKKYKFFFMIFWFLQNYSAYKVKQQNPFLHLTEHITKIHIDTITLLCDQCDYKMTVSGHLEHHTRIHSYGKHIVVTNINMKVRVTTIWKNILNRFICIPSQFCVTNVFIK